MIKEEIKGAFNGLSMTADNGNDYPVPSNYASKSKLIEGDRLILKITDDGKFIFKQVEPAQRKRIIATIQEDYKGNAFAVCDETDKVYKIIDASISYYKLKQYDRVSLIVPIEDCTYGAVEHVIE